MFFTLGLKLVSLLEGDISCEGGASECNGVNFLVIILSVASWNMVHNFSTSDCRFLSGRCRNVLVLMACERSFAIVTICSSTVILGQLNLLDSD